MKYSNITFATASMLGRLYSQEGVVESRQGLTREIRNSVATLEMPLQRCLFLPGRGNDPFAAIAETIWVFAGRRDIEWLERYLPRAGNFSDDGRVWRGGYGPRLRFRSDIDPLAEIVRAIRGNPMTRRAAMTLFDPQTDYEEGAKDVPCTNWLSFLQRDGRLNLTVGMRSNDVWWGFSGINAFEWSVLQQMVASWTGTAVGDLTFVATSLHLYEKDWVRAARVLECFRGATCYQVGIETPQFSVLWERFDAVLEEFLRIEERIRDGSDVLEDRIGDPLLDAFLNALRLKWAHRQQATASQLAELANGIPTSDIKAAALVWLGTCMPGLTDRLTDDPIRHFVRSYLSSSQDGMEAGTIAGAISSLHRRKDSAYGNAWKKRGEAMSILPNIARKIDRLSEFLTNGSKLDGETVLDTAIDLLAYVLKYRLFLIDQGAPCSAWEPNLISFEGNASDGPAGFEVVIESVMSGAAPAADASTLVQSIASDFETLHRMAEASSVLGERAEKADALLALSAQLVVAMSAERPLDTAMFVAQERERAVS